jgi:hypothetical protein
MVILGVELEVLGELRDALGEQGHLNLTGSGVAFAPLVGADDLRLAFGLDQSVPHEIAAVYSRGVRGVQPEGAF